MINQKDHVEGLFRSALEEDNTVIPIDAGENVLAYYDEESDYMRRYHYDDTRETIAGRVLMDPEVETFLKKDVLADFIIKYMPHDVLMVLEKLVLLWEDAEGQSPSRDAMETEYEDGYAQYIADGMLGQTWTDRQIMVVNVSVILESCREIHMPGVDPAFNDFFLEAVLQTLFHESRHLLYECNEIVSTGKGTPYPHDGGLEDKVEEYGNAMAHRTFGSFREIIDGQALNVLLEAQA